MPVEVRRNGVGAFLVQLFGHKKTYKIEIQFFVGFLERREGLATPQTKVCSATPFPSARCGGPCKTYTRQKLLRSCLLFFMPMYASQLAHRHKKQKDVFRHLLASFGLAEREGFEA